MRAGVVASTPSSLSISVGRDRGAKPYRDTVLAKCPDFLDQALIQLSGPLAGQKCLNGGATLKEFRPISPVP